MDPMTTEEKQQFSEMQTDIKAIQKDCEKIDEIYFCLIGNKLSQDGGLVNKIHIIEERLRHDNTRIKKLEAGAIKIQVYIGIAAALAGAVISGVVSYVVNHAK